MKGVFAAFFMASALASLLEVDGQAFGSQQDLLQMAMRTMDPCEIAIWNCCQSSGATATLPENCFAQNGCPGLFWHGSKVCSARMLNRIARRLQNNMVSIANSQQNQLRFAYP
ncbi:hypothetical protein TCAL_04890 [Tigriopus californicus]|uniref:Uncharacterized protein n=1 Tax=Tigriopus californicus TaxID=6832 RepID=A0A553NDJ8_TIGCA|nr:uncharacterized protein LOC131888734 [Tigriopus californicus]TRY63522.1 hypothetical protein TCAL_04890 [Tigriopus californicus]|eukprot:TCALIF_04890-PA protein Name:"Protein of unknown function" AED:0.00 eAED:0.00 QI:265/1/1/1/1/1/2/152/112